MNKPDFGNPVTIGGGEASAYYACGVTSSMAVLSARLNMCVTHASGHMFISDVLNGTPAVI
ncbi:MAG: DUF1445 domain-containing protein [Desulfobacterales bacterium]|nr:DUF1445 domain-containing protein [Desulfobacterales bacterium]